MLLLCAGTLRLSRTDTVYSALLIHHAGGHGQEKGQARMKGRVEKAEEAAREEEGSGGEYCASATLSRQLPKEKLLTLPNHAASLFAAFSLPVPSPPLAAYYYLPSLPPTLLPLMWRAAFI